MRLGILGLPQTGKTTLFHLMTAARRDTAAPAPRQRPNLGVAKVPDPRLAALRDLFRPRRYTPATVEYVDVPALGRGEGREGLDLAELRMATALVHVVRAFEAPQVPHPEGSVDPPRDVHAVELELILADMEVVERRIERLRKAGKAGLRGDDAQELELLEGTILPALEQETPIRRLDLDEARAKRLRGYQLLSEKPLLLVVNVGEAELAEATAEGLGIAVGDGVQAVVVSAPIEAEIAELPAEEQAGFLAELGLDTPGLDRVLAASYELLGLISFFTVGEDEVRAWTIRRGTRAREAAGVIHSDLERGFIRAEVVPWRELLERRTLAACREAGVLRIEGKEYVLADGDVAHFRFNV